MIRRSMMKSSCSLDQKQQLIITSKYFPSLRPITNDVVNQIHDDHLNDPTLLTDKYIHHHQQQQPNYINIFLFDHFSTSSIQFHNLKAAAAAVQAGSVINNFSLNLMIMNCVLIKLKSDLIRNMSSIHEMIISDVYGLQLDHHHHHHHRSNFADISFSTTARHPLSLFRREPRRPRENKKSTDQEKDDQQADGDHQYQKPLIRSSIRSSIQEMHKFLLAGAVSTIISRTCVAPLERIKLECMIKPNLKWLSSIKSIWGSEGILGFWKGNLLNLFRMVPFKSINFICYDLYCDHLVQTSGGKHEITSHDRFIGGGISGVVATLLCLPLDTIRTRLLAPGGESLGGVFGCFTHMVRKEGFLSLYKGLTPTLLSMGPASAIFYGVYDILKAAYLKSSPLQLKEKEETLFELGALRTLMYGAIAGACAETMTYPLEVVRRQLQLEQTAGVNLVVAFGKMIKRDGVGSMFAGLVPSTMMVLPSAALSYLFYEMMKSILKIN